MLWHVKMHGTEIEMPQVLQFPHGGQAPSAIEALIMRLRRLPGWAKHTQQAFLTSRRELDLLRGCTAMNMEKADVLGLGQQMVMEISDNHLLGLLIRPQFGYLNQVLA
ncbi:hypothetical protein HAX54_035824 [Datura stramonium]|uniref:Uncharacterized protein n=1 Tax=Datura stramonium TaxID=4076 RepID=A0ABS8RMJ1_DATST|nr:hypothetical protein [Datura stramonium]